MQLDGIVTWFVDIVNYLFASILPLEASKLHKDKLNSNAKYYEIRKCIPDPEIQSMLQFCHFAPRGKHYRPHRTTQKDAHHIFTTCEQCQRVGMTITCRHDMPQQPILFYEVFDVSGIDSIGLFLVSYGYAYILLVDYMEAKATKTNDAKVIVVRSNIFFVGLTNEQAKVFNKEIKKILQKIAHPNRKDWKDALQAHKTTYQTPLGMSPYWITFGKVCHLPIEIEHCAYWAMKR
ncbi:hypothetical protein CR513_18020, partial [Mucuna pruriens]